MRISDWSSDVCSSDLTGERAGSGIGEARIEQIDACKTEDRRKQRIEWHSEGPLRAEIAPAENEQGNSDKKEKEPEDGRGIFNHRLKSVAGERSPQHQQDRARSLPDQRVNRYSPLPVPVSHPAHARDVPAS